MLEIAQHVMSFLHKHDRPPISLHEEMVMRQKEEEKKKMLQLEAEEAESRLREIEEVGGCDHKGPIVLLDCIKST